MARNGSSQRTFQQIRKLIITTIIMFVLGCVILGLRYYDTIQSSYWYHLKEAQNKALEQLNLKNITAIERYIGDKPYAIVFGTDPMRGKVAVWIWQNGHYMIAMNDAVSKDQIRATVMSEDSTRRIHRIVPGKLGEEYVWEVFLTKLDNEGINRQYYEFFRFTDGVKIETYRLAKQLR
jgi:uncharacterized protein YpmB